MVCIISFMDMKKIVFLLIGLTCFTVTNAQNSSKIELTDLLKIKTILQPQFSPDGKQYLYLQQSIIEDSERKGEYIYLTNLYLGDLSNKETRALTSGKLSVSSASWSPDGKYISFVRQVGDKPQVFILPVQGGEAYPISHLPYGASSPEWSKDGSSLHFTSSISPREFLSDTLYNRTGQIPSWNYEKPGLQWSDIKLKAKANPDGNLEEIRAYLFQNEREKKAKVINQLNFQEENFTTSDLKMNAYFKIKILENAKPELLINPFRRIEEMKEHVSGQSYLVTIPSDTVKHPNRVLENIISFFDVKNNTFKTLVEKPGYRYSNLSVSPDGKFLAFFESKVGAVANPVAKILALNPGASYQKVIPLDRVITQWSWAKDASKLYFTAQDQGGVPLYEFDINLNKLRKLSSHEEGVLGFDQLNQQFICAMTKISNPSELYYFTTTEPNPRALTQGNAIWLQSKVLSLATKHSFKNKKGMNVDYWVMKPADFDPAKKYPLLLEIHGGPTAMWGTGEASMWHEFQYFAAKGYGVVYSNPRGSGGYGTEFMAANVKDWGQGPMSDVIQSLDLAIGEGWADTTKLAVTGGSYAGYLVTYMLGHTNRFKVACSQRGVYELSTFFGEGNAWRLVPNYFGGYPWEKPARMILDKESPLTYVQNIKTPLIIFHGEQDLRTGVIQSEMLFKSLKVMGKDVEYVRHPGANHEITRSGNNRQRLDQMLRTYEFFQRYIK
ncbi:S9 family peptidase [Aquirufa rosea]|uniref:S9 family peptidase n=2 Tax=Aquirufa rosea TaxID=2509241 RepID=A0A4Q1C1W2_9BACT|nr:S9 family peptidase [Aquirufa rosea]